MIYSPSYAKVSLRMSTLPARRIHSAVRSQTLLTGLSAVTCLLALICWPQQIIADNQDDLVRAAVARVAPSVVRIRIIGGTGGSEQGISSRTVTGISVSTDGDIVTSAFGFTEDSAGIFVVDATGNRVAAKVVATDHVRKLVLLKCESGEFRPVAPNPELWPDVGKTAIALGRFYDTKQPTVSVGIVSAVNRIHGLAIQTDAKISPVNYGGPLIDLDGRVLGILVPLSPQDTEGISAGVEWYDSGIGFCIPLRDAVSSAKLLSAGKDRHRGLMGVALSTRNPLEPDFSITRVEKDSPAAAAGLKKGDVIMKAAGQTIRRFGEFQAVVKSSYAGDNLPLVIKRGEELVDVEVQLAEKLELPERGELGLIALKSVDGKEDQAPGVLCRVVANSAMQQANVPAEIIISEWNGEKTPTTLQLKRQLSRLTLNEEVSLTLRSPDSDESRTVSVKAKAATTANREFGDELVAAVADLPENAEWKQASETIGESEDRVWFYAPAVTPETESGLVVLLNRSAAPTESTLRIWQDACHRHNLIAAVIQLKDGSPLSREHVDAVRDAIRTVAKGRSIDTERLTLVAGSDQTDLCTDLLWNPRAVGVRSAVFVDCRPQTTGLSQELIMRKGISTMLLSPQIQSRQELALQRQAISTLKEKGARVTENAHGETPTNTSNLIANWLLSLKVK